MGALNKRLEFNAFEKCLDHCRQYISLYLCLTCRRVEDILKPNSMKLILSRKGFDSSFGGCASPIFEDDTFVSLPIPEKSGRLRFSEIEGKHRIGSIVEGLTRWRNKSVKASDHVHLDPDLRFESLP